MLRVTRENTAEQIHILLDGIYRRESRRLLATLNRLLGDFDLAEDGLHEAFRAALERWPTDGVPANPCAWLISAGRFKAIDALRRRAHLAAVLADLAGHLDPGTDDAPAWDGMGIADHRLRLIFTCCHPALSADARIALTLREVCGLPTGAIARALRIAPSTLAQRIVRAKAKIRTARLPDQVPAQAGLPGRLDAVLQVIYLVFNEGYAASTADPLMPDLAGEAIRLARRLAALLPEPEVLSLLALLLLHDARRAARTSPEGDLVLLEDQDRALWNREQIAEGLALVERALAAHRYGPYTIQAAIAAVHALAPSVAATDWAQLVGLYDRLVQMAPSPLVELNRAVAIALRDGPAAGLALIDAILARGDLAACHLAHAARADLCQRLGRTAEARAGYQRALGLARREPERRLLAQRLAGLPG